MKKLAVVVWDDFYHPKEVIAPLIADLFPVSTWELIKTTHFRELLTLQRFPDLILFYSNGRTEDEPLITDQEQQSVVELIKSGAGALFCHAGMVWMDAECPIVKQLNCGYFLSHPDRKGKDLIHPEQCELTTVPLMNCRHPILEGVSPFTAMDEHYFVAVDIGKTNLLACTSSVHGVTAGVWTHEVSKGTVVSITAGHTAFALDHKDMRTLQKNAVKWCIRNRLAADKGEL